MVALSLLPGLLLFGGVLGWTVVPVALCITCGVLFTFWVGGRRVEWPLVGWVIAAGCGMTLFQAIPFPAGLVEWSSPSLAEEVGRSLQLLGQTPTWLTFSYDPASTRRALVTGFCVLSGFSLGAMVAGMGHRRAVVHAVGAVGVVVAVVSLVHLVAGASLVYGFYRPVWEVPRPTSPLLNPNHLGAVMQVAFICCVGSAVMASKRANALGWLVAAGVTFGTAIITGSRSTALGLGVSLALFVPFVVRKRPGGGRAVLAAAAVIGVMAVGFGADLLVRRFHSDSYAKPLLAIDSMKVALQHPWLGVGRGAFGAVYNTLSSSYNRYVHPENILAQWWSEWGLVGGSVMLFGVVGQTVRAWRASDPQRRAVRSIGLSALAGLLAHDLFDFSMEATGVAALAGCLLGASVASRNSGSESERRPARSVHLWAAVGTVVVVAAVAMVDGGSLGDPIREADALREAGTGTPEFRAQVTRALEKHPLEPALLLLGAHDAALRGDRSTLRWLNRVMQVAPDWPQPRVLAAEFLHSQGHTSQALLEWRAAEARRRGAAVGRLCALGGEGTLDHNQIVIAAPRSRERHFEYFDDMAACLGIESAIGDAFDRRLLAHDPDHRGAVLRQAARLRVAEKYDAAAVMLQRLPPSDELLVERAELLMAMGEPSRALEVLESGAAPGGVLGRRWLTLRATAAARAGETARMRAALTALRGRGGASAPMLAVARDLEARLEHSLGNDGAALRAATAAYDLEAQPGRLRAVASYAQASGNTIKAREAYERLCETEAAAADCAAVERIDARDVERSQADPQRRAAPTP